MSGPLRLILFDVDGTLVDSQDDIVRAMELSFEALGLTPPKRLDITGIIGLSLEIAVVRLMPGLAEPLYEDLVAGYKPPIRACERLMAPHSLYRFIPKPAMCCNLYGRDRNIFWVWQRGSPEEVWIFCWINMACVIILSRHNVLMCIRQNRIRQCCRRRWLRLGSRRRMR